MQTHTAWTQEAEQVLFSFRCVLRPMSRGKPIYNLISCAINYTVLNQPKEAYMRMEWIQIEEATKEVNGPKRLSWCAWEKLVGRSVNLNRNAYGLVRVSIRPPRIIITLPCLIFHSAPMLAHSFSIKHPVHSSSNHFASWHLIWLPVFVLFHPFLCVPCILAQAIIIHKRWWWVKTKSPPESSRFAFKRVCVCICMHECLPRPFTNTVRIWFNLFPLPPLRSRFLLLSIKKKGSTQGEGKFRQN